MRRREIAAIATVGLVIACGFAAALWWYSGSDDISVDGGILLGTLDEGIEIRCVAPEVTISLAGYHGHVRISNCVPGSDVEGFDGELSISGTSISFDVDDQKDPIKVVPPGRNDFSFAVIGDSQGHNNVLQVVLESIQGCEFVIHCGDLTPSGGKSEYAAVEEVLNASALPVYTTVGNHDVKNDGATEYSSRFGPTQYHFDYGGMRFAFVDTSDLNFTEAQADWLREVFEGAQGRIVVTHVPSYDPFGDNHTLTNESCSRFSDLADELGFTAVLNGHIHAFDHSLVGETDFIITGGAGGTLVNGSHHFVVATLSDDKFVFEKTDIESEFVPGTGVALVGRDGITVNLTFEELASMDPVEGDSSYENYFGNVGGVGHYSGVSIATLVELVGGMSEGDVLTITSSDGYLQTYGYLNVYPNETWNLAQGEMVLALEYDSSAVPDWDSGPRIAMMPSDGLYSNGDCELTSYPGQGYWTYPSAGARWVGCVSTISVQGQVSA
ncbi:MAG TPA: metallophosphoesterase [Thermoplasmata archaeon]|nr:metallophosphoesterase [Thermoplasmata archaeon]